MSIFIHDVSFFDRATGDLVRGNLRLGEGQDGDRELTTAAPACPFPKPIRRTYLRP